MAPGTLRDGDDLVGLGMATSHLHSLRLPAQVRVSIDRKGEVLIETSTQEMGTGVRTIMPQIAAEALGVPTEHVTIRLGDTDLPVSPFSAGSSTTMSVGSAVHHGAVALRTRLVELGGGAADPAGYGDLVADAGLEVLSADGRWDPGAPDGYSMASFGAVFAEVRVDCDLAVPRVSRVTGVYSVGRVVNPRTAAAQMIGSITWGIGQALLEESAMDHRLGRYLSKNMAGYLVPVNADVPDIDVAFVAEVDTLASPIGARGLGELAATGVGAAIANAVFHATGRRVREVPVRPEMLL